MGDEAQFGIGSSLWPGTSKAIEECGELTQVLGKLIATGGATEHWDGSDLRQRLVEEIGDVRGALTFFISINLTPAEAQAVRQRERDKRALLEHWHREQQMTTARVNQPDTRPPLAHLVTSGS